MKKIIFAIVAVGAISAIIFHFSQTPSSVPATVATSATTVNAPVASVALPVVKPVAPSSAPLAVDEAKPVGPTPATTVTAAQAAASQSEWPSPRAELATTIPELVRLIDAQDFETLMQDFMPPDELNALLASVGTPGQPMPLGVLAERMRQNPRVMQQMAAAAQFLNYVQTQTPIFDATGNIASYPMGKVINGQNSLTFVKVGGYWYVKNGVQFFK
jgi:hypothetical protein